MVTFIMTTNKKIYRKSQPFQKALLSTSSHNGTMQIFHKKDLNNFALCFHCVLEFILTNKN